MAGNDCPERLVQNIFVFVPKHVADAADRRPVMVGKKLFRDGAEFHARFRYPCQTTLASIPGDPAVQVGVKIHAGCVVQNGLTVFNDVANTD